MNFFSFASRILKFFLATAITTALILGVYSVQAEFFSQEGLFPSSFELSELNGKNGFAITSTKDFDYAGYSVDIVGDMNQDGLDDMLVGAYGTGRAYVVLGSSSGFPAQIELDGLDGNNGFLLEGIDPRDDTGLSVSAAGDINADGYGDIIIGARQADPNDLFGGGEAYVVFGNSSFPAVLSLAELDGDNGFTINAVQDTAWTGRDVADAGDINNDGIDDIIIGASGVDPHGVENAGQAYIIFGREKPFPAIVELSSLDGERGFAITGIERGDSAGTSVAAAGDMNGDGFDDVMIGAKWASPQGVKSSGEAYVVFGKPSFAAEFFLSSLDGLNGFTMYGISKYDYVGQDVASVRDVNSDGFDDVMIGGLHDQVYVVFGNGEPFSKTLKLAELNGKNGFTVQSGLLGSIAGDNILSTAGDFNNDGYDDILIGSPGADPHGKASAGAAYTLFGKRTFPSKIQLEDIDGQIGLTFNGIDKFDWAGDGVGGAGDVNGDGIDDIIIGAWGRGQGFLSSPGESYVIFGYAPPQIEQISGTCPGEVHLKASGLTPRSRVVALGSHTLGSAQSPVNRCSGAEIDLENPTVLAYGRADKNGEGIKLDIASEEACSGYIQILDFNTCATTNIQQVQTMERETN